MKFKASKNALNRGINIAAKAAASHTTMPIMSCILLEADEYGLTLTGNDLEIGISTSVEAEIIEPGSAALDAKMLQSIIGKMPNADIEISIDEDYIATIRSGKARFSISGQDPVLFTGLPDVERDNPIVVSGDVFREMILGTLFSVATNETSKVMTGELVKVSETELRMVALDGHRMAIRETSIIGGYDKKVIVPAKSMSEISRIINPASNSNVCLELTDNHIVVQVDDTFITSRLIEGEYFDIDKVISNNYEVKVTADKSSLIECIERAGLFVKAGDKRPIVLEIGNNEIQFSINSPTGAMNESLDVETEGNNLRIGFNPHLLADAIKATPDNQVNLYFTNEKSPCYIKDEEMNYLYMILPVNLTN